MLVSIGASMRTCGAPASRRPFTSPRAMVQPVASEMTVSTTAARCQIISDIETSERGVGLALIRPRPVHNLRAIGSVLVGVAEIVDDRPLHLLLEMRPPGAKFRDAIDDVDHQMESRCFIQ